MYTGGRGERNKRMSVKIRLKRVGKKKFPSYRVVVAENEQHGVIGYATSGRFRAKEAYETTVEVSIQCAPTYRGGGLGRRLYDALFTQLAVEDVHCAVAGIAVPNPASVALHERMGFQLLGTFPQVGRKFQRYWDVVWMQKFLG